MSFYIGGLENELDRATDAIEERLPRYQSNLVGVQDIRVAQAECARIEQNMTTTGTFRSGEDGLGMKQIAAGVPWSLWATMAQKDPYFWTDKKKVYKWLRENGKKYRTGETVIRS